MASVQDLRRRIRSIRNTRKITKAMERIAASRILKAQQRVNAGVLSPEEAAEAIRSLGRNVR